jgi:hypothetical protein
LPAVHTPPNPGKITVITHTLRKTVLREKAAAMQPARMFGLVFLLCGLLPATGCYYKVQNFGYTREIGIGSVGCEVPKARITWSNVANQPNRPQEEERSTAARNTAADKSSEKSGAPEPDKIPASELPPPVIRADVPPANSPAPRPPTPPPQSQRKGWVGLPDF